MELFGGTHSPLVPAGVGGVTGVTESILFNTRRESCASKASWQMSPDSAFEPQRPPQAVSGPGKPRCIFSFLSSATKILRKQK